MIRANLAAMVTAACALDREIAQKQKTLAGLEKTIKAEAAADTEGHQETAGGGWSWTCAGTDGCLCRVTKPGPGLRGSIDGEDEVFEKLRGKVGVAFLGLFSASAKFKLVENFRERARELFGADAAWVIRLCSTKGKITVGYETKQLQP